MLRGPVSEIGPTPPRRWCAWLLVPALLLGCQDSRTQSKHPTAAVSRSSDDATPTSSVVAVIASLPPLADLCRRLGGDRVEVNSLLPRGASPHTFSLSPRDAIRLEGAQLVIRVGHPSLPFESSLLNGEPAASPTSGVSPRVVSLFPPSVGTEEEPHLWLSPAAMAEFAPRITKVLQQVDPAGTPFYDERLRSLLTEIENLQSEIAGLLRTQSGSRFLVYHPAWASFAREFSLQELAVEVEGKEATAKRLTELIEELSEGGFGHLYTEVGTPQRGADALARELDLEIIPLDTLPNDWFAGLRGAAAEIAKGLVP